MTITLRIVLKQDAKAALARDSSLASAVDVNALVFELDSTDPRFHRLLELTRHTTGAWLNPIMKFSPAEMAQARCFQLECRGKIVRESPQDYEANRARLDARDFHRDGARRLSIKLIDRVALTRVAIAPNAVGCASDWMAEFVIGAGVASALEQEALTGYELRPIVDARSGKPHAGFFQLYSESIMPDAVRDATTLNLEGQTLEGGWRELGCLTYAFTSSEQLHDFNRTAEDWSNNHIPVWVVSGRVRDVFQKHRLKGWAFRPVLEAGTPLHQAYVAAWADLLERMSINPANRF